MPTKVDLDLGCTMSQSPPHPRPTSRSRAATAIPRISIPSPALLLVGGLDPTGQAGLARDLLGCQTERLRGCPVSTGTTVQTSAAFLAGHPTPPEVLHDQAEAALAEHEIRWVKVGALWNVEQIEEVASLIDRHELKLVLDPVLGSTSGTPFLDDAGIDALRDHLIPLANLITPNAQEALTITGRKDPEAAARRLVRMGAKAALVKRGGRVSDLLWDGISLHILPVNHLSGNHRGTGCRLASHTAALLARGMEISEAVWVAHAALQNELHLDASEIELNGDRLIHFRELESWFPRILDVMHGVHVPEVGSNVAYAMRGASKPDRDVAGLAGRITIAGDGRAVAGRLAFGGPHHTGRIAVVLQEYDPEARIVLNHRYGESFVEAARKAGLVDQSFRREDEPPDAPSSMEWGVRHAINQNGGAVPDLIWDLGGPGKEPMIRVIARNPEDLVDKLHRMHGPV